MIPFPLHPCWKRKAIFLLSSLSKTLQEAKVTKVWHSPPLQYLTNRLVYTEPPPICQSHIEVFLPWDRSLWGFLLGDFCFSSVVLLCILSVFLSTFGGSLRYNLISPMDLKRIVDFFSLPSFLLVVKAKWRHPNSLQATSESRHFPVCFLRCMLTV